MQGHEVPDEVMKEIKAHARELADGAEERKEIVETEKDFYRKYKALDRSALGSAAPDVEEVFTYWSSWEERFEKLSDEIAAAREMLDEGNFGLPDAVFLSVARRILISDDLPTTKLEKMRAFCKIHNRINPIKQLLIEAEKVIGNECFNGYIQNYVPYGQFEGEGRKFRFPLSYRDGDQLRKTRLSLSPDIDPEVLARAFYGFGANDLFIMGGLLKVLDMIEHRYGISFREMEERRRTRVA